MIPIQRHILPVFLLSILLTAVFIFFITSAHGGIKKETEDLTNILINITEKHHNIKYTDTEKSTAVGGVWQSLHKQFHAELEKNIPGIFAYALKHTKKIYKVEDDLLSPLVRVLPAEELNLLIGCDTTDTKCMDMVTGLFNWVDHIVYIDERTMLQDPAITNALLVHEFTHYLQYKSGIPDPAGDCEKLRGLERQAYFTQYAYVRLIGRPELMSRVPSISCNDDALLYYM